jgi:hypothetical protein
VLNENIAATLSHSVPAFGCQSNSFERARARCSTLCTCSEAVYVFPEIPHVKGLRDSRKETLPCFSLSINWLVGISSGGSVCNNISNQCRESIDEVNLGRIFEFVLNGALLTHEGVVKTITVCEQETATSLLGGRIGLSVCCTSDLHSALCTLHSIVCGLQPYQYDANVEKGKSNDTLKKKIEAIQGDLKQQASPCSVTTICL